MPSVRVKRHSYSSLDNNSPNTTRTLVPLFRRNTSHQNEPEPSPLNEASTGTRTMRKRTGSRVQDHLLRAPLLEERRVTHRESPDSSSIDSVVDSPTVGIQLQGGRDEGLDSTLSLAEQSETEHHHDIVEYLDVIDAQVATANNLTNAANAILIPPMSFYSRKPEIRLSLPPSPTIDNARKNEEEGRPVLEDLLDRHVDDVIRRRDKIRRTLKGVWSFLKTPFGVIVGIYGFLVVFWGAAIVFFLAKIINLHNPNTQAFWVEISSQIVNGLFTVTGIGLIPFRVMDTYRIARIYSYKRRTRELRAKAGLPPLLDEDDLPDPMYDPNYVHVLNEEEEKDLHRQQVKFHHSQSWYRPHGTKTHRAFPIGYGLLICCLNDGNSIFQIMLCGTMWGLNRFQRPAWSTGCLIPLGFLCGIGSAVFIALGSGKTKRTAEVENRLKAALATYNREGLEVTRPSDDNSHKAAAAGPPDIEEQSRLRFEKPDVDAESGTLRELSSAS